VVAVLDRGVTAEGRPYLVLERLEGRTLRAELAARGPLPAAEALGLAVQALDGLAAIHAAGVVHRDVKLTNLFVCDARSVHGRVLKLLDLGVAKVLAEGKPAPLSVPTAEGFSMGTPRFFSPEQATGAALDARADVYAMGLVLYALLTGHAPFEHIQDVAAMLEAHATRDPPAPSDALGAPLDPRIDEAVMRALSKSPDHRFPSAQAFAAALRTLAPGEAHPAGVAKTFAIVLLASLSLSMAATALWHLVFG
jgi:serine/threonine-protein kinase